MANPRLPIEAVETAYYRLPLEPMGDAGHGAIDTEELILVRVRAGGQEGLGYAYTIGRGGRAIRALIEHDLAPLLLGRDAADVEGLWERVWRGLLVGRPAPCEDEARVAAGRALIGNERDLLLDANMGWTAAEALERGRRLEAARPYWLEEPTVPEDVAGHRMLVEQLATPIAIGESLH